MFKDCTFRSITLRWWLEHEFTGRKVRGSNPIPTSRLTLSRLGQAGSILALMLPLGGTAASRRKGVTAERLLFYYISLCGLEALVVAAAVSFTDDLGGGIGSCALQAGADKLSLFDRLWLSSTLHVVVRKEPLEEVGRLAYANKRVTKNGRQNECSSSWGAYVHRKKERKRSALKPFRCLAAMLPEGSTRTGILPGYPSLDRGSRVAEVGFEPRTFRSVNSGSNHLGHFAPVHRNWIQETNSSAVAPFRWLAVMPTEGGTRVGILPGCTSPERSSRDAELAFEPRTFRSNSKVKKAFSCSTLPVPNCHATRRKHEGWDTARLPKPRQGKSSGGGRIRTMDLPVSKVAL
ncbi:hypothetical protein T265_04741 [Opisthorchis viverrini]|uniref:Uncharacterized protein n=1 Tax=Opisthorchis viverrini TaxID=6198 RepID=A0A074ZM26_OPIVI|nr:hypothetical protein T265_04741 [Opisthorchis viverrini]KER28433.1 hypothetical protein T265_04741 [Opisthorchis viverrini]